MKFRIIATILLLVVLGVVAYVVDPSVFSGLVGGTHKGSSSASGDF